MVWLHPEASREIPQRRTAMYYGAMRHVVTVIVLLGGIATTGSPLEVSSAPPWREGVRLRSAQAYVVDPVVFLEGDSLVFECGPGDSTLRVNGIPVYPRPRAWVVPRPSPQELWMSALRRSLGLRRARTPDDESERQRIVDAALASGRTTVLDTTYEPRGDADQLVVRFRGETVPTIIELDSGCGSSPVDTTRGAVDSPAPCLRAMAELESLRSMSPFVVLVLDNSFNMLGGQTGLQAIALLQRSLGASVTPAQAHEADSILGVSDSRHLVRGRSAT